MIDAHFHIWRLDRADYGWLTPALGAIHRDVSLDDWRRVRAASGITAGVLVQAAPTLPALHTRAVQTPLTLVTLRPLDG